MSSSKNKKMPVSGIKKTVQPVLKQESNFKKNSKPEVKTGAQIKKVSSVPPAKNVSSKPAPKNKPVAKDNIQSEVKQPHTVKSFKNPVKQSEKPSVFKTVKSHPAVAAVENRLPNTAKPSLSPLNSKSELKRQPPQPKNIHSNLKQQPVKSKSGADSGKAVMTTDKDKNKLKEHNIVKQNLPPAAQSIKEDKREQAARGDMDFSAETLALLFKNAKKAAENAYVPYSKFKVGAVLVLESDSPENVQISAYTGCNVENASYGLTCCAERIAIYKAISDGNKKFKALILYASSKNAVSPCGACRQVIAEFASPDMKIYSIGQFKDEDVSKTPYVVYTVAGLLPHGFKASDFIEK